MKATVEICGMEFFARHGCLPEEREKGNTFLVDVSCTMDLPKACESDRIEDTLDCRKIYDIVAAQMQEPSNLLENVCWRIRKAILETFPEVEKCEVGVSKKNPPLSGPAAFSKFTLK